MGFSVSASLSEILDGELRMDATYYTSSVYQAKKVLEQYEEGGKKVSDVGAYSVRVFNPPPIKRVYTDNRDAGAPYMLPQEMFDFYWSPKKFVLADKMPNISDWYLKERWVVLTQSGSVGKPYLATTADKNTVLSQNAIRVVPKKSYSAGFLYAYFMTWLGQTLLKKDEFGITVKHIRPHHVSGIPVPDLDESKQKTISEKIERAFKLRAEAIKLINEATQIIYDELGTSPVPPTADADDTED
jgi:type I restriction enzyme S subunit